jgi:hypothetical protein
VGKVGWKNAVTVEGCIVGGELHAAGLRQPSWSLDERSHPSQSRRLFMCVFEAGRNFGFDGESNLMLTDTRCGG